MNRSEEAELHVERILAGVDYTECDEATEQPGSTPELLGATWHVTRTTRNVDEDYTKCDRMWTWTTWNVTRQRSSQDQHQSYWVLLGFPRVTLGSGGKLWVRGGSCQGRSLSLTGRLLHICNNSYTVISFWHLHMLAQSKN